MVSWLLRTCAGCLNAEHERLEDFTIAPIYPTSGISLVIFQMSPSELAHTCNAFRNLTAIKLKKNNHNLDSEIDWERSGDSHNIARVLSAARNLIILELAFYVYYIEVPRLEALAGIRIWQNLRSLTLGDSSVKEDELANFLNRHEHFMRNLKLDFLPLLKDFDEIDDDPAKHWHGLYRRISHLNLASLEIFSMSRSPVDSR